MYNPKSTIATEFIDDQEIRDTLRYADENKDNLELINRLIDKTDELKGLTHREAAVLLACEDKDALERIFAQATKIKQEFYGNRIVMFAPLYLSNYCVNGCTYCPYHKKNGHIARKKLTQEEIRREVIALQDMGHKRLALETGEDPVNNPIEYILESIKTIYSIKHKNGAIRRVNVNIAATTVENYRKLKEAGIGTYILFQETYHKEQYEKLHPTGPKSTTPTTPRRWTAPCRAASTMWVRRPAGNLYRYDFVGLLMHAEHLKGHGVGPHTIGVPRLRNADDIDVNDFSNAISDELFQKIVHPAHRRPLYGPDRSTRESQRTREMVINTAYPRSAAAPHQRRQLC
ncbi:MAG: [FeFe] hydrogenase H-cluster radical SAM maturase HydG [Anaeromassilibacillus sp.]